MPPLVLIEDDPSIGGAMQESLQRHGYEVSWFRNGADASAALEVERPDLVLLDLGLPDIDGFTICRWLRETHPGLPIILVTARDAEIDIVVGLDAGATDYVTKPFSTSVLLARVRAHLRSTNGADAGGPIEVGRLRVEPTAYRATVDGVEVELRRREFELLVCLAGEAGRVVTRERLLSEVWDLHWDSSSKTLEMHVLALRRKLGDAIDLVSIRGVGYRLDAG